MPVDHHYAQLWLSLVPDEVRKSITPAELNDRVLEADRLSKKAADLNLGKEDREEARARAQQVMRAAPRAETERLVAAKVAKAAQLGNSPQADMLRRQAQDLLKQNPPAPRRDAAVRKAEADIAEMVPVFDQNGQLIGIADPGDITPVRGSKTNPTPEENAQDEQTAENVAKATGMVAVYDAAGRPYLTYQRQIRKAAAQSGELVTVTDSSGRSYRVPRSFLQSPEVQARNTGPVSAGGTTGLGQPRATGPAAALPGDGPQAKLPGDLDRTVIKALNPGWTAVHDYTGRLVGAVKSGLILRPQPGTVAKSQVSHSHANVYDASRRRVGMARLEHILPVADLRKALGTAQLRGRAGH